MRYASRQRAIGFHLALGLGLSVLGMLALAWGLSVPQDWQHWLGCWLVAVNVVAFGYYGFDKARSGGSQSRVPEWALHGLTAAGGSLGAYAGMQVFRHKTIKTGFRIVFWCIVVLETALIVWLIQAMW